MGSVNQARPQCVNQMGKTHSKPLAARHGRGTAWARHAMCELALKSRSELQGYVESGSGSTDMPRLTTGIRCEKCVVRRFRRYASAIECTYTNLATIAYYRYASLNDGDTL